MESSAPSESVVRAVVALSVVITAVHYADNYASIHDYPEPTWINRPLILLTWALLTLLGLAGYMLYRSGVRFPAGLYLLIYSFTGLSSLGHYRSGTSADFTAKMHLLIRTDAVVGAVVAAIALWILLGKRETAS